MIRHSFKVKIGENRHRYRTIVEENGSLDPNESFSYTAKLFLKALSDTPDLLLCGFLPFKTLKMYHNGVGWVAEAEAEGE